MCRNVDRDRFMWWILSATSYKGMNLLFSPMHFATTVTLYDTASKQVVFYSHHRQSALQRKYNGVLCLNEQH